VSSAILNEDPENAKALVIAGCVMLANGDYGAAMQFFRRATALAPKIPNTWMHYGASLQDLHKYDEAREAFLFVHKALPDDPMPQANIAATYVQVGKANETVDWADKALAAVEKLRAKGTELDVAARAEHVAHVSRSYGCLALGRWEEGWKSAEHLYGDTLTIRVYNPPESEEPMWDGSPGKTVVVQADQGLGDMIMFAQCINPMLDVCKKVIIDTTPRLVSLFKRTFPKADVYGTLEKRSDVKWPKKYEIDAHTHLSFLGRFYRKTDGDFPKQAYLTPDPALAKKWRAWLGQFPKPWVGIAWRGGIQKTNEASRSMALKELAPIIKAGGTIINLAYQEVGLEISRWNMENREQILVPKMAEDYDDTVALVSELDEVVTVQTTLAHVCGALGKKCSVLVNQRPQWRYCYGGDHLMWYPDTLTIYRQKPGEIGWSHAISRLARGRIEVLGLEAHRHVDQGAAKDICRA